MEGITIDDEGSVFHNGKPVTKALFNDEQYFSGSVKEAIKDLPADIVARIQIIDRNAEGSGGVQLQSQEKTKVMNIVTKEDKSAGRMIELGLAQGLPSRSRVNAGMRRIDGSRQLALEGGFSRAPEGIKADDVPGTLGTTAPNRFSGPGSGQAPVSGGQHQTGWLKVGNSFVWDAFKLYPDYRFEPEHRKSNTRLYSEQYFDSGDLRSDVASRGETRQQTHRFIAHAVGENFEKKSYHMTDFRLNQRTMNGSTVRHTTQTGFANRRELEEEDRESRVTDVSLHPQFNKTLSTRWQLGLGADIRYSSSDEGIDTRYEIHALADSPLSADSSIRQSREEQTLNWTSSLQSLLTWTANAQLKIQFRLATDYREAGHDVEAQVWDGEIFRPDAVRSSYLRTSSLGIPMSVTPEYTFKGGFYVAPELAWQPRLIRGQFERGTLA